MNSPADDMANAYSDTPRSPVNLTLYNERHPSTQHMMKMLAPNINLKEDYYKIANEHFRVAQWLLYSLPDSPELTAGLRKLLEAKDCFVRALVDTNPVNYTDR